VRRPFPLRGRQPAQSPVALLERTSWKSALPIAAATCFARRRSNVSRPRRRHCSPSRGDTPSGRLLEASSTSATAVSCVAAFTRKRSRASIAPGPAVCLCRKPLPERAREFSLSRRPGVSADDRWRRSVPKRTSRPPRSQYLRRPLLRGCRSEEIHRLRCYCAVTELVAQGLGSSAGAGRLCSPPGPVQARQVDLREGRRGQPAEPIARPFFLPDAPTLSARRVARSAGG
jgi:hypothetical protein